MLHAALVPPQSEDGRGAKRQRTTEDETGGAAIHCWKAKSACIHAIYCAALFHLCCRQGNVNHYLPLIDLPDLRHAENESDEDSAADALNQLAHQAHGATGGEGGQATATSGGGGAPHGKQQQQGGGQQGQGQADANGEAGKRHSGGAEGADGEGKQGGGSEEGAESGDGERGGQHGGGRKGERGPGTPGSAGRVKAENGLAGDGNGVAALLGLGLSAADANAVLAAAAAAAGTGAGAGPGAGVLPGPGTPYGQMLQTLPETLMQIGSGLRTLIGGGQVLQAVALVSELEGLAFKVRGARDCKAVRGRVTTHWGCAAWAPGPTRAVPALLRVESLCRTAERAVCGMRWAGLAVE